jgi:hypothetical protein
VKSSGLQQVQVPKLSKAVKNGVPNYRRDCPTTATRSRSSNDGFFQ